MQFITLQIIAIVIAGLMVGNELAVSAFVHPQLSRLDDQCHAAASKALALSDDWKDLRQQWDRLHDIRVGFLAIAFICLTIAYQLPANC